ncbi:hypothetical protein DICA3_E16842 [Diutina catenulata]
MKTLVVLGNSFAGYAAAQTVLAAKEPVKLVVVAPSETTYNNTSAPRLLVEPELGSQAVINVKQSLEKQKGAHQYEYVTGKAEKVDTAANKVFVAGSTDPVAYDFLVVATGHRNSVPGLTSANEGAESAVKAIKDLHDEVVAGTTVCVIGGGPTGVEIAAEVAQKYPTKKVTLVTGTDLPLAMLAKKVSKSANSKLESLGVEVVNGALAKTSGNTVTWNDEDHQFDVVIPTWQYTPNSEFFPDQYKDNQGYIVTDANFVVEGLDNVFAFGDVSSATLKSAADVRYFQHPTLSAALNHKLSNSGKLKPYSQGSPFMAVPIGSCGGVGSAFGWSIPSLVVWFFKSKDYMIPAMRKSFSG